jgi:quercetin dioxygenase-like cupin family protein
MAAMPAAPVLRVLAASPAFSAFEVHAPAGTVLPPHVREAQDGALVVLAGAVAVGCEDGTQRLGRGGTVALPRGAVCRVDVVADAVLLAVVLPGAFAALPDVLAGPVDPDDLAALLAVDGVRLLPTAWQPAR